MIQTTHKYLLGTLVSLMIVGCGSSGGYENGTASQTENNTNTQSTNANSTQSPNNATNSQTSNTSSTTVPQCTQAMKKIIDELSITYASNTPYNYSVRYKESDDSKGSSDDSKGSGDDSKGSSDGEKGSGGGASHNQGRACAQCHSKDFASGATVFTKLNANTGSIGAVGYKIQLGNTMVYSTGRGDGNSHLNRFSGGNFTAHVIDSNGNIVNSSTTNSHDSSRLDCNRCHTAGGAAGAPGRIVNYKLSSSTTTTTVPANANASTCVSFNTNVMPILNAKCKSCHGSNGNFTISSANGTYANIGRLKSPMTAGAQYLIDKGSNRIGHGGGSVISTSSAEYKTIKAWINEGALNN